MRPLALLILVVWAVPAHATSARFVSLRELVKRSDTVLLGRAISQDSFWHDDNTRIYTLIRLEVEEVWAGKPVGTHDVDVLTLGGVVGDIGQRVDGAAQIPVGQQVVIHLHSTATGEYQPVAMAQGVWLVHETPSGALTVARPHVDRLVGGPGLSTLPTTLTQLKQAIQEAANAP